MDKNLPNINIPDEILHGSRQDVERYAAAHAQNAPQPIDQTAHVVSQPMNRAPVSALEDLLTFGSLKREVDILGTKFLVKTLNTGEKEDAYGAVSHLPTASFVHFSSLRDELLARAVEKVNGLPLTHYYKESIDGGVAITDSQKAVAIIKHMYGPIVDKLYELYNILEEKAAKLLSDVTFDDIKNS